ncbi:MAG: DUF4412 domain-containing protein [Planctomycetes bacterium]|nr:DUF4412 domain-containing protein [Planctomycetota bacterium]
MKYLLLFTCMAALSLPAFPADTVVTKAKHTDAITVPGSEKPAEVETEVTWVGMDRMRVDVSGWTTIVRWDTKKIYQINHAARSYSVVDVPTDLKKYMSTTQAKYLEESTAQVTITVVRTAETRKVKDWDANKYVLTMTLPKGGSFTESIWVTKDLGLDTSVWMQMWGARMSLMSIGALMAKETLKIPGIPVLVERSQKIGENTYTGRDEVVSVECKDAPEGHYEPPQDYTIKPFELSDGAMRTPPPVDVELVPIKPTPPVKDPVGPPPAK